MAGEKGKRKGKQGEKPRLKNNSRSEGGSDRKVPHRGVTPDGNVYMVWREDYNHSKAHGKKDTAPDETRRNTSGKLGKESVDPDRKTGKRLFIKTSADTKEKSPDLPPPGYESHKDIQYKSPHDEELAKAERRQSRKNRQTTGKKWRPTSEHGSPAHRTKPASLQSDSVSSADSPTAVEIPVKRIFTLGMGHRPVQKILQKLVDAGVRVVIDLRSEEAMVAPGFTKARDLAILLKEAAGIEYRRDEVLLPRKDILEQYRRDNNWTRFSTAFHQHLVRLQPEKVLNRDLFAREAVALLGEQPAAEHSMRIVVANYLSVRWEIHEIINL